MQRRDARRSWSPDSLAGYWVNRASRALIRYGDRELKAYGLTLGQLPLIHALAESGPLSTTALAARTRVEQPTMTEMVSRMKRAGTLVVRPNPEDGRSVLVSLHPEIWSRFDQARETLLTAERRALAPLNEREQAVLRDLLHRLAVHVEGLTDSGPGDRELKQ